MPEGAFDIYQADGGYTAVTNPVQRQILDALRAGDKQLPELVEMTGRSKPTLSSLHMKELLARELIEERPHATDSRRKVYRLRATKIGSSDIPVQQLREAVRHYVSLAPIAHRLPLGTVLAALLAAPAGTDAGVLRAQAARMGQAAAALLNVGSVRDLWMRIAGLLEAEQAAVPVRVDARKGQVDLRLVGPFQDRPAESGAVLAGFLEGMAHGKGLAMGPVRSEPIPGGVRLQA